MTTPTTPDGQPWTVDLAARQITEARRRRDPMSQAAVEWGDRMAIEIAKQHPVEELETVGAGLLRASSCLAAVVDELRAMPSAEVGDGNVSALMVNMLAFAGERLLRDGRATYEAIREGARS